MCECVPCVRYVVTVTEARRDFLPASRCYPPPEICAGVIWQPPPAMPCTHTLALAASAPLSPHYHSPAAAPRPSTHSLAHSPQPQRPLFALESP
eukprot:scaffold16805_cov59-Phaeocystis_antarctica.AAC.4